ncbi:MAG: HAD family hydrolase [Clostridia bacterium]|nr:HAD family hydrolase [Clostridia bacterium]
MAGIKKYKAILFDLDGTLLPLDYDTFLKKYFSLLVAELAPFGYSPKELTDAVWAGTAAMVKNDGKMKNEAVFWNVMEEMLGCDVTEIKATCDAFYEGTFMQAKEIVGENPLAKDTVKLAKKVAGKVVLATNPLFPMVAQKARMSWVGLSADDFDIVTSYETDSFSKPNYKYYLDICERLDVSPSECLMIGNDEKEDCFAATLAGMDAYLVEDNIIECEEHPWAGLRGSFEMLYNYLEILD